MGKNFTFYISLLCILVGICHAQINLQDLVMNQNGQEVLKKTSQCVFGITCSVVVKDEKGQPKKDDKGNILKNYYYGTGVLISKDGLALTNTTVAPQGADEIKLFFQESKVINAKQVFADPKTETSILQAEGKDFPYLHLADTSKLQLGTCVYTLGNPYYSIERDNQVAISRGIVSGLYDIVDNGDQESKYQGAVIETNAALNPGSDGGPLLDSEGKLVGILSLAYQKERRIGVAIPVHVIVKTSEILQKLPLKTPYFRAISPAQKIAVHTVDASSSVVAIQVKRQPEKSRISEDTEGKDNLERQLLRKQQLMQRPDGLATGVVVENGEYVITSAFHISHQDEGRPKSLDQLIEHIYVLSPEDGQTIPAKIIARHMPYDLALLKLEKPLKSFAQLAADPKCQVGTWVGVAGRQRGSKGITLTTSIISALERNYNLVKVVQTQASINYANTGGPVFDIHGNVIGVSMGTTPESSWGLNSGVGLFVDSKTILSILPDMMRGQTTQFPTLPFLGVGLWTNRDSSMGAIIATITHGSAAYEAGVKPGDILISLDRKPIREWSDLVGLITTKQIGQEVEFEVIRDEKVVQLKATLKKRPF